MLGPVRAVGDVQHVIVVAGRVVIDNCDGVHLFEADTGALVATFAGVRSTCEHAVCDRWVPHYVHDDRLRVLDCVEARLVDMGPAVRGLCSVAGACLAYTTNADGVAVVQLSGGPDGATVVREVGRVPNRQWFQLCDGGRSYVVRSDGGDTVDLWDMATGARIRSFAVPAGRHVFDLFADGGFVGASLDNCDYVAYAISGAAVSAPFLDNCVLVQCGRACDVLGYSAMPFVDIATGAQLPYAPVHDSVLDTSGALISSHDDVLSVRATPGSADRALNAAVSRMFCFRYGVAIVGNYNYERGENTGLRVLRSDGTVPPPAV